MKNLTNRFADNKIPTWKIVNDQNSGRDGMTTYNIASPSNAAATPKLVTIRGTGGKLSLFIYQKHWYLTVQTGLDTLTKTPVPENNNSVVPRVLKVTVEYIQFR